MTDAEKTIRHSVLLALVPQGCENPKQAVEDVLNNLFSQPIRWAVQEYLNEINETP